MILSKGNLQVVQIAVNDKNIPGLGNVLICRDGKTVAVNRNAVIVVGKVDEAVRGTVPLVEKEIEEDIVVPIETIKEIIRSIPRDVLFNGLLEHCDVSESDEGTEFVVTDGKRKKRIGGKKYHRKFVDWKGLPKHGEIINTVLVNFKRLHSILDTIEKICQDSTGESIVSISVTKDNKLILRAKNMKNHQEVQVISTTYADLSPKRLGLDFDLTYCKIKRKIKKK